MWNLKKWAGSFLFWWVFLFCHVVFNRSWCLCCLGRFLLLHFFLLCRGLLGLLVLLFGVHFPQFVLAFDGRWEGERRFDEIQREDAHVAVEAVLGHLQRPATRTRHQLLLLEDEDVVGFLAGLERVKKVFMILKRQFKKKKAKFCFYANLQEASSLPLQNQRWTPFAALGHPPLFWGEWSEWRGSCCWWRTSGTLRWCGPAQQTWNARHVSEVLKPWLFVESTQDRI